MILHVCPWWLGYVLANPARKLLHNPTKILQPYIKPEMTVLDYGSAMGFFSLPLAKLVGPGGKVICADLQEKMLKKLKERAAQAGLTNQIETRHCNENEFNTADIVSKIDFALLFAVVHEVPDSAELLKKVYISLKNEGSLLLSEPKGHVSKNDFEKTINISKTIGFSIKERPNIWRSHSVLLYKDN